MVLRTVVRVVAIVVGTIFVGVVGVVIGILSGGDVSAKLTIVVVTRSVLVIALLLALTRAFRMMDRKAADHAGRPAHQVLIAAGLACVLNLAGWGGQPLFGQLLVPAGVFSALIDIVVWMAVAVLGALLGDRARVQATVVPVPYAGAT